MPGTTDYDTIAERYAAEIDGRPWNALYERPATLALLPAVGLAFAPWRPRGRREQSRTKRSPTDLCDAALCHGR